jgi:hypothetical protein
MASVTAKVDFKDLLTAFKFASMGEALGCLAFVSVKTGETFVKSDDLDTDEPIPADLETSEEYLCLPDRRELDLGRDLVFSFIQEKLPDEMELVRDFFRRRGAYPNSKTSWPPAGCSKPGIATKKRARKRHCADGVRIMAWSWQDRMEFAASRQSDPC